jgi:LL-diaminopimelate aminotransferase
VLIGAAGGKTTGTASNGYEGIVYVPCTAENGYFPDLHALPEQSIFYFCSPNNPTGAVITRVQLEELVHAVQRTGSLLVYDAAYSSYIRDAGLPTSVYEIDGADTCAIEINSFSKSAGFTGVRLGWSVVPHKLCYADGEPINKDWARITGTIFNGASNIAQWGGLAALEYEGLSELRALTDFYMGNARLIREAVLKLGVRCSGGDNSPYIWARFPGEDSWAVFERILETCRVVTTPGVGFGPSGQSHIRFSAFGHRADIEEAAARLARL